MKSVSKSFLSDNSAVAEEFSSLPALTIVVIGLSIFIVLIAQAYGAYVDREQSNELFEVANEILEDLTSHGSLVLASEGTIDGSVFLNDDSSVKKVEDFFDLKYDGVILLSFDEFSLQLPQNKTIIDSVRVSVSKNAAIRLNDLETKNGVVSVIVWRKP